MYCKNCGHEIKSESKYCPQCGIKIKWESQTDQKRKVWLLFLAIPLIICVFLVSNMFKGPSSEEDEGKETDSGQSNLAGSSMGRDELQSSFSDNGQAGKLKDIVATVQEGDNWYIINEKNKKLAKIPLDGIAYVDNFNEYGVAQVEIESAGNWQTTYINTEGKVLAEPFAEFTDVNSYVWGKLEPGGNWYLGLGIFEENGKWGFIDADGNIKIPPVYDAVDGFAENGLAAVKENERWGYINTEGEMVIPPSYIYAWAFGPGDLAMVEVEDGVRRFIDESQNIHISTYYEIEPFNDCGLAEIRTNGKAGCMDIEGNLVVEPEYETIQIFDNGCISVGDGGKTWVVDAQGEILIEPFYGVQFISTGSPDVWLFYDTTAGKYGMLNAAKGIKTASVYYNMETFGDNGALVYSEDDSSVRMFGEFGQTQQTWEKQGEGFWHAPVYNCASGKTELLAVRVDGAWHFMKNAYSEYMESEETFDAISEYIGFSGAPIAVGKDQKWGYIDSDGELMIDYQYDTANRFFDKSSLKVD